ncbi:MAG: helix-turn-helix transcriptional regulator, partial [Eubacteriales bacterium]|nr:helix-turn-helix transcriptional regulator [Eubacteriales bacterium]
IKMLRATLGLSQRSFGEGLGVSRDVISNIENKRTHPSDPLLESIIKIHSVNRIWLINGSGEMFRKTNDQINALCDAIDIFNSLPLSFQEYALNQTISIYDSQLKAAID